MPVVSPSSPTKVGPFHVMQPLPSSSLDHVGPFVLLHHGMSELPPQSAHRISPHPHRGFSPVSLIFQGEILHKDSAGNEGVVGPGGAQWLDAGSGVVHSEGPSEEFSRKGGLIELIQLWINVPAANKMDSPTYASYSAPEFPEVGGLKLVAGAVNEQSGPAKTHSPLLIMFGSLQAGKDFSTEKKEGFEYLVYVLKGSVSSQGQICSAKQMMVFSAQEHPVLHANEDAAIAFLGGLPINEPMASYGPFVMNNFHEIQEAIEDFQNGRMGMLDS
jgi:redox-sensitive bicupin YhaK (pirin superfamily)